MLQRIIDGRTDLVFDYLAEGQAATSEDRHGTPLIRWCAYHGDVSAIRFLLTNGESLESLGENLDLNGAVLCRVAPTRQLQVVRRVHSTGGG